MLIAPGPRSLAFVFPVVVVLAAAILRGGPPQTTTPQFRSGTDIVTVDVTVLDRGGEPITRFTAEDFTLAVDGRPRRIQSVRLVRSDGGVPSLNQASRPLPGQPDQPPDAVPILSAPRCFVIVIDREHIPVGEGQQMLNAAAAFLDAVPADDRIAVWTTTQTTNTLRFNENRETQKQRIRMSVGTYRMSFGPWNVGRDEAIRADRDEPGVLAEIVARECYKQPATCPGEVAAQVREVARDARDRADVALANIGNLVDALATLDGPKHLVLVSGGPVFTIENGSVLTLLAARAAAARVTVHALQVHDAGYQARVDQMRAAPEQAQLVDRSASVFWMLAGATGGLAITPVSGEVAFKRLTRELSAAYLLAFETQESDRDGKVHQIDVQVRDRGWGANLRARKSFRVESRARAGVAPPVPATDPAAVAAVAPAEPVGIDPGDMADRLADYAELFERHITAVVAEERFVQIIHPWRGAPAGPEKEPALTWVEPGEKGPKTGPIIARRQLVSDVLMVQSPGQAWQSFRDVAEVDGRPVRDRADRVQRLFLAGGADRSAKFQEIALESARYNIGDLKRDLNLPTVTLSLLRRGNHPRFKFKRQKDEVVGERSCRVLAYNETMRPTLVSTRQSGDVYLYGRVWLDKEDGRVRRTELRFDRGVGTGGFRSVIQVDYGTAEGIDVLVPVRMWEWYEGVNQLGRIGGDLTGAQGFATYTKYRKFLVSTTESVK